MMSAPGNRNHGNRGVGIRVGVATGTLLIAGVGVALAIQQANAGRGPAPVAQVAPATSRPRPAVPTVPKPSPKPVVTVKPPATPIDPALDGVKPELAAAFTSAKKSAAAAGLKLTINSGYRSASLQQKLLDQEIRKRGSYQAAVQWVLPPKDSAHVQGEAVDVGPTSAASWLQRNGYRWGLCRRYLNESWHFELLTSPGNVCPAMDDHARPSH
jgi:zinc D-Ala-D-Ala carboxypeptidase